MAAEADGWWVAVDDGADGLVFAFEGEDFSWGWGAFGAVVEWAELFVVLVVSLCCVGLLCEGAGVGLCVWVVV